MSLLKRGLRGAAVERLQRRLDVPVDGAFEEATETAVRHWQHGHGLLADGVAGPDTLVALGLASLVSLRMGSRGDLVRRLQERLDALADGEFGAATRQAVVDFQRAEGLEADGTAGPATLHAMGLIDADPAGEGHAEG